jgi:hypothetical protein
MSANRMHPLLLLYAKMLQCLGWNSAEVMTCTGNSKAPHILQDGIKMTNTTAPQHMNSTTA